PRSGELFGPALSSPLAPGSAEQARGYAGHVIVLCDDDDSGVTTQFIDFNRKFSFASAFCGAAAGGQKGPRPRGGVQSHGGRGGGGWRLTVCVTSETPSAVPPWARLPLIPTG